MAYDYYRQYRPRPWWHVWIDRIKIISIAVLLLICAYLIITMVMK